MSHQGHPQHQNVLGKMNRIFSLLVLVFVLSCDSEELPGPMINDELQPYVDRFYDEAETRGFSLAQNIDALIADDVVPCGQGHSPDFNGMFDKPTIIIRESCWENLNDVAREILVFHELGHALLNRIHIEGILPNGHTKSIMCAGVDFDCSDMPDYFSCPDYRDYYIDELFDEEVGMPQWATRSWDVLGNVYSDLGSAYSADWQVFTDCASSTFQVSIDSTDQDRPSDYSLRLSSACGEPSAVRKRIAIGDPSSAEAIRLKCDLYQDLAGEGLELSLFVKDADNSFSSFNRTIAGEIINSGNAIRDFTLQAECLTAEADSLIVTFQFLPNTEGVVLIGNLDIQLMD